MNFSQPLTAEQEATLKTVLQLAQACDYPRPHTHQITRLALRLFDDLFEWHQMGPQERFWLHCAALLHDIGWIEGEKAHHKATLNIILNSPILTMSQNERLLIGSIARYHRRALPDPKHDHFAALSEPEQKMVSILAAILRVADGLDAMDLSRVQDASARISAQKITITYQAARRAVEEEARTIEKSDLLRELTGKKFLVEWKPANH